MLAKVVFGSNYFIKKLEQGLVHQFQRVRAPNGTGWDNVELFRSGNTALLES